MAIADYAEAIRLDSGTAKMSITAEAFTGRAGCLVRKKEFSKARRDYLDAIRQDPRHMGGLMGISWLMCACPVAEFRDGAKAVEYANAACDLSHWKDNRAIEALAAAHAERGDYAKAIEMQKQALRVGKHEAKEKMASQRRLSGYEAGKPYRFGQ
jgi:tetratricopeptide (TPR) repeat protein